MLMFVIEEVIGKWMSTTGARGCVGVGMGFVAATIMFVAKEVNSK